MYCFLSVSHKEAAVIGLAASLLFLWPSPVGWSVEPVGKPSREENSYQEEKLTADDRDHWAFQPLQRPAVPEPKKTDWARNAIDHFVMARLASAKLEPLGEANRRTLIRRLSLDLTGLPPSLAAIQQFQQDPSVDAYDRLVQRLLASPHYAERQAQHWLDLARFAETDGFEHDKVRKHAWKYRDWVIQALNRDLPYDQFVRYQLAADELLPQDTASRTALMFCLAGPDMPDINSQDERRHTLLNEMTGTVSSVFMGLQMECAQCHDHKYDPISQADFYRLRAVFEPAVQVKRYVSVETLLEKNAVTSASHLMIRGDFRRPGPVVEPGFPRIVNGAAQKLPAAKPSARSSQRRVALARWLTQKDHPLTARVMVNRLWQSHFGEGLCRTPSDFGRVGADPSHPQLLDYLATELIRRQWSLKQLHGLIVSSATYRQAGRPADLALQEQLPGQAQERLQRAERLDAENELLARFPRQRLDGEVIRDLMLYVAGTLDTQQGGAGVRPPLSKELVSTLLKNQWEVHPDPRQHHRRSIYVFARRNLRYPIFDLFDRPDANASCPRRNHSTTAPQSLFLLNSRFSLSTARRFAGSGLRATQDKTQFVHWVFLRSLGRPADPQELQRSVEFLIQQQRLTEAEGRPLDRLALPDPVPAQMDPYLAAAYTKLCLAIFNLNEFIYVD